MILDFLWFSTQKKEYQKMVEGIQKAPFTLDVWGAIAAYIVMFVSLYFIIYPMIACDHTTDNKLYLSLKYAAIHGFVVYGIFNATNYAIFKNYPIHTAILDTIWGTFVYFIAVYLTLNVFGLPKNIKKI
jgi:uncharacterized membrane protein